MSSYWNRPAIAILLQLPSGSEACLVAFRRLRSRSSSGGLAASEDDSGGRTRLRTSARCCISSAAAAACASAVDPIKLVLLATPARRRNM